MRKLFKWVMIVCVTIVVLIQLIPSLEEQCAGGNESACATIAEKEAQARAAELALADQRRAEAEEKRKAEAEAAESKNKGFHCLSGWDGAHDGFKNAVRKAMRDPSSFEHIETGVTRKNEYGKHGISMTYRARNGFGGMNVGTAVGIMDNASCEVELVSYE